MSEDRPTYDNEIEIFRFFKTLWNGKKIITVFTFIAILIGIAFYYFKAHVYESKLIYQVDTSLPNYDEKKALSDFRKIFYSKNIFEECKKSIGNISLVFKDIDNTYSYPPSSILYLNTKSKSKSKSQLKIE